MAKRKTVATKAPTGLVIARNGDTYVVTWKIGDSNYSTSQQMEYRLNINGKWWKGWVKVSIGVAQTTKSLSFARAGYFPNTKNMLKGIEIRIRGQRRDEGNTTYTMSGWTNKTFMFAIPSVPTVTANPDGEQANVCKFTWNFNDAPTSSRNFTRIEYQSFLADNVAVSDASKLAWKSTNLGWLTGTYAGAGTYSRTITEATGNIATGSHTRVFRVRAVGVAGASAWRYAMRVYATPNQAVITNTKATNLTGGGHQISVNWNAPRSAAYPTDSMTVEYAIGVPRSGMQAPSNPTWNQVIEAKWVSTANTVSFTVSTPLNDDECLWVRVNTIHIDKTREGVVTLVKTGNLAMPTITSVATDSDTHMATVTATNASTVPDSFMVVLFRRESDAEGLATVGIIPNGSTSVTVECPPWGEDEAIAFGVYAAVGTYTQKTGVSGDVYAVTAVMSSADTAWQGGEVPQAPTDVTVASTNIAGTVRVTWSWAWQSADVAVLSWADHADAWESTNEPEEYTVSNLHASEWNIAGLTTGKTWYIRVRLGKTAEEGTTYSPWSAMQTIDLSSAPTTPTLMLSDSVIPVGETITAYWSYATTDGTAQAYAEICEAEVTSGGIVYGTIIAEVETAQHVEIDSSDTGWSAGEVHYLAVRVVSSSGKKSDSWSAPVPVKIAEPIEAVISSTSLSEGVLTVMPLTITVTGASAGGTTMLAIERAAEYRMDRPDEDVFNGYDGETIALIQQMGEDAITVDESTLIGSLDDGAQYRIVATVKDGYGQSSTVTEDFTVAWAHQAVIPEAEIIIEDNVAKITVTEPAEYEEGDVVDIYRLSADKPELVIKGGEFEQTYVDPYPVIGEYGGYRVVYRTKNGDYITATNQPAWTDYGEDEDVILETDGRSIIDFDGEQIMLYYSVNLSNEWTKDFRETHYLGGSIQGDWNAGVSRSASLSVTAINQIDYDLIRALKRLASYTNICHIRTLDGSSYACDIQVSESRGSDKYNEVTEFSLAITRIDTQELDGVTLETWEEISGVE